MNWEEKLSEAGVLIEGLSSNGETLLIKVKDSGKGFEYGIYDEKKLELAIHSLLTAQLEEIEKELEGMKKEVPPDEKTADISLEILGGETIEGRAKWFGNVSSNFGYNQALDAVVELLQKHKNI